MEMAIDIAWAEELPELYAIDGVVPGELLEEFAMHLDRNLWHPGRHIAMTCERKSLSIPEAAVKFGIECADLTAVIEERASVTPDLALRMEAAGWSAAEVWMQWQCEYDLAQERQRRERADSVPAPQARTSGPVATAS